MKNPQFVIQMATNSINTKIICNDEDISSAIRAIEISQRGGELPVVRLELSPKAKILIRCEPILELIRHQEELEAQNPAIDRQSKS